MTFQVGDWVLLWGQVCRVVVFHGLLAVLERRDGPGAGCQEHVRGHGLAYQQRGHWEGSPVNPTCISVDGRSWSHRVS